MKLRVLLEGSTSSESVRRPWFTMSWLSVQSSSCVPAPMEPSVESTTTRRFQLIPRRAVPGGVHLGTICL